MCAKRRDYQVCIRNDEKCCIVFTQICSALRFLLLLDLAQRRLGAAIAASAAALGRRGLGLDGRLGGRSRGRRGRGQVGRVSGGGAPLALLLRFLLRRCGCAAAG